MIDKFNQITMQDSLARLRPHIDALIANTLIKCANDAITPITVKAIEYSLRQLSRKADLANPEEIKNAIATSMNTKAHQPTAPETKNRLLFAYDKFCRYNEIKWEKPYYKSEEKTPLIPTPQNVQAIRHSLQTIRTNIHITSRSRMLTPRTSKRDKTRHRQRKGRNPHHRN